MSANNQTMDDSALLAEARTLMTRVGRFFPDEESSEAGEGQAPFAEAAGVNSTGQWNTVVAIVSSDITRRFDTDSGNRVTMAATVDRDQKSPIEDSVLLEKTRELIAVLQDIDKERDLNALTDKQSAWDCAVGCVDNCLIQYVQSLPQRRQGTAATI